MLIFAKIFLKGTKKELREITEEDNIKIIHQDMQKLGFTKNDARIYTTLLTIGLNSPATIADKSGVDRARVYDSLKRLVKKGIVEEEPVPRAPRYRAKQPNEVFSNIIEQYKNNIDLASKLNERLENMDVANKVTNSAWAVKTKKKIRILINSFLDKSEEFFYLIITQDFSGSSRILQTITNNLHNKKVTFPDISIKLALQVDPEDENQKTIINQLYHGNIDVFHWDGPRILPFGLAMNEKSFLQIYLSAVTPKPKYEFGMWMENCSKDQITGFKHLCEYVFANLCKRVIFKKRSEMKEE